ADSLLPIQFWAEAVNTACYVLNRVLVTKPQMKTPYEILMGRSSNISLMRLFGCSLTILNTLDQLGKFDGKSEEGYLLGYSTSSRGFKVYNRVTRKVQECLHVDFLQNQENQKGKGPDWMFDLDLLTPSMNYIPVRKENYVDSGEKVSTFDDVEDVDDQQFILHGPSIHTEERIAAKEVPLSSKEQVLHDELMSLMHQESLAKAHNDAQRIAFEEEKRRIALAKGKESVNSTLTLSTANTPPQSTGNTPTDSDDDTPTDGVFSTNSFDAEEGGVADYNNLESTIDIPSTPTLRIHKIHPQSQIIGKSTAGVQTRRKLQDSTSNQHQALLSFIYKQNRTNHKDQQTCLFACFLSQEEHNHVVLVARANYFICDPPLKDSYGFIIPIDTTKNLNLAKSKPLVSKSATLSSSSMVKDFEDLMQKEFKMSSMGELTFFLGLQVKQSNGGIFLSQDKYVKDILNKLKVLLSQLKKLSKGVKLLVKHHILWVKSQKLKKRGKNQKKKVSSVKLGRNQDEGNLSEEYHAQDDHNHTTFVYEDFDARQSVVTPDLERKSDETEEVVIEEEKDTSDVKSGDTEELDLERIQSTARQSAVTLRTLNFDKAGPSSLIRPTQEEGSEEQFKVDEFLTDIPLNISRPRGLSIPGPMQTQPQQRT
ncbi:ribonuclease H-like domain-containing protein, partial [Tanacetum coccineum]